MEAAGLGAFMISAGVFGVVLEHPGSPVRDAIADPAVRRGLMGLAMGLTAVGIIYSPWGRRSGAHINPAVTLTFFRLGKVQTWDAVFYVLAQFGGGLAGVGLVALAVGVPFAEPPVHYVVTLPGADGIPVAFTAEVAISFLLMLTILLATNSRSVARYTGLLAGLLVALYIAIEAPLSGMSMNPARTFASALPARLWTALWLYFLAPPLGMLAAAELYTRLRGASRVVCAKLHHDHSSRCIFRCGYAAAAQPGAPV
ncbi:MAG: aquaporin [Gemmatimonadota bacterium]|nr:aquaporin [Gemmatimonadota bacterium]